ncbi:DNA-directed RNA polymerase II subunit RPB1-like isoform X2 [Zophobas morio]
MSPDKEVSSTTSDSPKYCSPQPPIRTCSSSPLDLRLTPRDSPSSPLDLRTSVKWRFPLTSNSSRESPSTTCLGDSQLTINQQSSHDSPPYESQESIASSPQKYPPDGAKPSTPSNYTGSSTYRSSLKQYSFSSTERSSNCSPDIDSSPSIYYSTSSSNNSLSSRTCSLSSLSRRTTPQNSPPRGRYIPLSPVYASPYRRTNFRREYSPLSSKYSSPSSPQCTPTASPKCCSLSPEYKSTNLDYSPDSPTYHPSPPKYKPAAFDYSLASPQSPTYSNSSLDYSPLSPNYVHVSSMSLNDNKSQSPTFIDSPSSPTYTLSSLSYCPFSPQYSSPEYSPTSLKYYRSCDSLNNNVFKSPSSPRYRCQSPTCPYSQTYSPEYSPPIVKYINKTNTLKKYRSTSPTYYPLSPEYSPRRYTPKFNGRSIPDDDIPCVCCSPSPPRY